LEAVEWFTIKQDDFKANLLGNKLSNSSKIALRWLKSEYNVGYNLEIRFVKPY